MFQIRIILLAIAVTACGALLAPGHLFAPSAQASGPDSDAEDALHRAQDQSQQGVTPPGDDQPQQPDDNYPYPKKPDNTGAQINDLGQTQEKPPVGKAPPPEGQAMTPPGKPIATTATGYELDCHVEPDGGWFQPVQGVYQDDPLFTEIEYDYTHRRYPNPQLEKQAVNRYFANLPMVVGRNTVLMGVRHYMEKGQSEDAGVWSTIVIKYKTDCTKDKPVKFRFRLEDGAGRRVLYTSPQVKQVLLGGPPDKNGEMKSVEVWLTSKDGFPPKSFTMTGTSYFLVSELVDLKDVPIGLSVYLGGPLVTTNPLQVQFVPVFMGGVAHTTTDFFDFDDAVSDLASASARYVPDYYPLTPTGLPTWSRLPEDLSDKDQSRDASWLDGVQGVSAATKEEMAHFYRNLTASTIASQLGAAGMLGNAQRVVAIMRGGAAFGSDYERIIGTNSVGYTISTKVVAVRIKPGPADAAGKQASKYEEARIPKKPDGSPPDGKIVTDLVDTVAHELAHTLPDRLWSGTEDGNHNMVLSCDLDFHGVMNNAGWGERVVIGGDPSVRRRADSKISFMGPSTDKEVYTDQCTYGHLMPALEGHPDPDLLLVRGVIANFHDTPKARLDAFYDMRGDAEAKAGPIKDWGITLKDSGGNVLTTYPFDPGWFTEENDARAAAPLFIRIPEVAGTALLEIVKAGKVLASKPVSLSPPALGLDSAPPDPGMKSDKVHVAWHASSAASAPIKSSVFYSSNDGKWYNDQLFEADANQFDVTIDRRYHKHAIKIVVTDGSRSSEQVTKFTTR